MQTSKPLALASDSTELAKMLSRPKSGLRRAMCKKCPSSCQDARPRSAIVGRRKPSSAINDATLKQPICFTTYDNSFSDSNKGSTSKLNRHKNTAEKINSNAEYGDLPTVKGPSFSDIDLYTQRKIKDIIGLEENPKSTSTLLLSSRPSTAKLTLIKALAAIESDIKTVLQNKEMVCSVGDKEKLLSEKSMTISSSTEVPHSDSHSRLQDFSTRGEVIGTSKRYDIHVRPLSGNLKKSSNSRGASNRPRSALPSVRFHSSTTSKLEQLRSPVNPFLVIKTNMSMDVPTIWRLSPQLSCPDPPVFVSTSPLGPRYSTCRL